jgi:predicted permease
MGWNDVRLSARRLARRPVFAVSSVALIGGTLGIAVTVGSVAHTTLGSALPYAEEAGLVALYWSQPELNIPDMALSLVTARELPQRTQAFSGVAATLTPLHVTLATDAGPSHLTAGLVMPQAFQLLGLEPLLGRAFHPEEGERSTGGGAVMVSHELWQSRLGGSREALGASLTLDGSPWTVVGVLPPGLSPAPEQPEPIGVWFPMGVAEEILGQEVFSSPGSSMFRVNARLAPGVTLESLPSELSRIGRAIAADYPVTHEGWLLHADPLRDRVMGRTTGPLAALFLGGLLLFGVALVNLVALFRHRARDDARGIAIRVALGATSSRLGGMLALDALLLGSLAALFGGGIVVLGFAVLRASNPLELPAYVRLDPSALHLLAVAAASVASSLLVALITGIASCSLTEGHLRSAGRGQRGSTVWGSARVALGAQVAMTTFLAVVAIAATRSLLDLRAMDTGIDSSGILSARLEIPRDLLPRDEVAVGSRRVVERLRESPGVDDAFLWSPEMPADAHTYTALHIEGGALAGSVGTQEEPAIGRYHTVSPGAVTALGLDVVIGRDISDEDWAAGRRVALVSASAARLWWGDERRALGQRIQRTSHTEWSEVIGVVADAPLSGRYGPGSDNVIDVFFMFDQDPRFTVLLFARTAPGRSDETDLRSAVGAFIPEVPLYDVRWMDDRLRDQERVHRSTAGFTGLYALASLFLAAVGLAASTILLVGRRRVEIGVRQALGAAPGRVVRELIGSGLIAIVVGIGAGLALARVGLDRVDPVILTVGPSDPVSHLGGALILVLCGGAALVVPSLATVRRSPAESLRSSTAVG